MAEYGPGLTMGQCFSNDKERIRHALDGELFCGEDEEGNFEYMMATREECCEYIISAFDNAVYQALSAMASGRALDAIMRKHGIEPDLKEYMATVEEENTRFEGDYTYDCNCEEGEGEE